MKTFAQWAEDHGLSESERGVAEAAWNASSSQPSPVGQDVRAQFETWMTDVAKIVVGSSDPYPAALEREYWRVWQAALAARQPIDFDDEELQFYREQALNLPNTLIGAGVFSVDHDGDYKAAWANITDAIERLAARQPVGQEPVMYQVRCSLHPRWRTVSKSQFEEYTSHGWSGRRLYEHPPAQAVDLGQLREAVAGAEDFISRHSWAWNGVGAHPNSVHTGLVRLLALIDKGN